MAAIMPPVKMAMTGSRAHAGALAPPQPLAIDGDTTEFIVRVDQGPQVGDKNRLENIIVTGVTRALRFLRAPTVLWTTAAASREKVAIWP
jgi:hypothetical protein